MLAENVANADTPGYASKDLKQPNFSSLLRETTAITQPIIRLCHGHGCRRLKALIRIVARIWDRYRSYNQVEKRRVDKMDLSKPAYFQAVTGRMKWLSARPENTPACRGPKA